MLHIAVAVVSLPATIWNGISAWQSRFGTPWRMKAPSTRKLAELSVVSLSTPPRTHEHVLLISGVCRMPSFIEIESESALSVSILYLAYTLCGTYFSILPKPLPSVVLGPKNFRNNGDATILPTQGTSAAKAITGTSFWISAT